MTKIPLTEWLMTAFLRVVALGCLFFGLQYWAMLIGYSNGGQGRFDLLSLPWKAAATSLAVLYPVTAVGLWMRASWGPVLWVAIGATELAIHQIWQPIFGASMLATLLVSATALVYVVLRLALWRDRRSPRQGGQLAEH